MYATATVITYPFLSSNNMGEGQGNTQTMQSVNSRDGKRTVLSGYALRDAIRQSMNAQGASCFRVRNDEGTLTYGADRVEALSLAGSPLGWDDGAFGGMVALKSQGDEKKNRPADQSRRIGDYKLTSAISVTPAISCSLFDHEAAFVLGMKADGTSNPFNRERQLTRYVYTVQVNLDRAAEMGLDFQSFFRALKGLRVGGSHASNASEVTPEVVLYRIHEVPAQSGIFYSINTPPVNAQDEVDLTSMAKKAKNLGVVFSVGGAPNPFSETISEISVSEALETLIQKSLDLTDGIQREEA